MRTFTGVIMLISVFFGTVIFFSAESAAQEVVALVPIVASYVFGRALENFTEYNKDGSGSNINNENHFSSKLIATTGSDFEFVKVQGKGDVPKVISRMEWGGILDDNRGNDYTVFEYYKSKE